MTVTPSRSVLAGVAVDPMPWTNVEATALGAAILLAALWSLR